MRYTGTVSQSSFRLRLLLLVFLLGAPIFLFQRDGSYRADAANGCPTASFASAVPFPVGHTALYVAMGDINTDSRPDLVVVNWGDEDVSVLLNTTAAGGAMPSFSPQQTFPVVITPNSVAIGDFNGDGRPDLAVVNGGVAPATGVLFPAVSVLLNTTVVGAATPSFSPQLVFQVPPGPMSVAMGDLNGDGKPDLAVGTMGNTVSVLLNTTAPGAATPSFSPRQTFAAGNEPARVVMGDVNGDGKPDLTVANQGIGDGLPMVSVLLNTTTPGAPNPSFAARQTFAVGRRPQSIAMGDLNGDGRPDLAVANNLDNTVSVLLNITPTGSPVPSFTPQQTFPVGTGPLSIAMGDLNGDGRPDLTVVAGAVSVLLNTTASGAAAPSFTPQQTFLGGGSSVAIDDLNGDGMPDLAVAGSQTVSVRLNNCRLLPAITTAVATNITASTATLSGNVTLDAAPPLSARGIVLAQTSLNSNPTLGGRRVTVLTDPSNALGAFSENATGLMQNTQYSFRAYATNQAGTTYGDPVTFMTLPDAPPTVTTVDASNVAQTSATLNGNVTSQGDALVTQRGIIYALASVNPSPTIGGIGVTQVIDAAGGLGSFSENVTGLLPGGRYAFRAFATNAAGTALGATLLFTTTTGGPGSLPPAGGSPSGPGSLPPGGGSSGGPGSLP